MGQRKTWGREGALLSCNNLDSQTCFCHKKKEPLMASGPNPAQAGVPSPFNPFHAAASVSCRRTCHLAFSKRSCTLCPWWKCVFNELPAWLSWPAQTTTAAEGS